MKEAGWVEVVPILDPGQGAGALARWRAEHDPQQRLVDDDFRVDVIRTRDGERIRVWVRGEAMRTLGDVK
jgi:hypothetical protein